MIEKQCLNENSEFKAIFKLVLFYLRNLTNLESPNDPAWLCIAGQYKHCSQILFQCKDKYLSLEQEEIGKYFSDLLDKLYFNYTLFMADLVKSGPARGKRSNNLLLPSSNSAESSSNTTPGRVTFLEELNDRFISVFPELWKLGQAYFGGELFVRADTLKKEEFKVIYVSKFHCVFMCIHFTGNGRHTYKFIPLLLVCRKWYWMW